MNKGTNISEKSHIVLNMIIPVALAVIMLLDTASFTENVLSVSFSLTLPEMAFKELVSNKKQEDIVDVLQNSNLTADSAQVSTIIDSEIPQDINNLMLTAEKKYANSSNDGKIVELDYSRQNATSEFEGILLRNTTLSHKVNISDYINKKVYANVDVTQPAVLIYHTHSSETYELLDRGYYTKERSSLSENPKENMIRIGEEICRVLEKNGYKTIHDKTVYDKDYSGAYDRSLEGVRSILKENPSVQVVLDVHRGTIYQKDGSRIKTITEAEGKKVAQLQIISGCEDGNVTDFPNWERNFTFALNLQKKIAESNPGLVRPLLLCSRKYNMHLIPCALQLEIGTDANTLSEAVFSARFFAQSLSELLKEYET